MKTESISEAPINRYIAMKGHFSFQQKGIFQKDYWAYKSNPFLINLKNPEKFTYLKSFE